MVSPNYSGREREEAALISIMQTVAEMVPSINPRGYETACWMRWLYAAMHGPDEPFLMMDYDVVPKMVDGRWNLPNTPCTFNPVGFSRHVPCCVSFPSQKAAQEFAGDIFHWMSSPLFFGGYESQEWISRVGDKLHGSDMTLCAFLGHILLPHGPEWHFCREYEEQQDENTAFIHVSHHAAKGRNRAEIMRSLVG
jgi:hypothetical protein